MLQDKPSFIDEVIVIDNNSDDKTEDIAKRYGAAVVHEEKRGYGQAYQAGLPKARSDVIAMLDGDNSYPISEVERMLSYMERKKYDFVVGCRYPLINKNAQPVIKRMANYFISWLIRVLFRIKLIDAESGMMVFKKSILNKVKPQNRGMGFSREIKINAYLTPNINCGEFHISYLPRIGKSKFKKIIDSMQALYSVLFLGRRSIDAKRKVAVSKD